MMTADAIVQRLRIVPLLQEGGYYSETYRSAGSISLANLPRLCRAERSLCTAIYFLLTPDTFSALHMLPGDELYHFYLGDPVEMLQLRQDGTGEVVTLGPDLIGGMLPQVLVKGGVWQGSRLRVRGKLALLGTTIAPGFDFADLTVGQREKLVSSYPDFEERIRDLTR